MIAARLMDKMMTMLASPGNVSEWMIFAPIFPLLREPSLCNSRHFICFGINVSETYIKNSNFFLHTDFWI